MKAPISSKPVVMMVDGKPVGRFDCIGDVAKIHNVCTTTITSRILRGTVIDNVQYRFREGDEDDKLPNMSPGRKKPTQPKVKKAHKFKSDDVDLTDSKYTIVPYEVRDKRVCITRCTALEAPQPYVGSGECARCPHFQGRDKRTHQVECSNILRRQMR